MVKPSEKMALGEFYRDLRIARKVKQKDVARGDLTAAQLSRFESGQSMLSADKLLIAIEGINMTFEEFGYKWNGYTDMPCVLLSRDIAKLFNANDKDGLKSLLESEHIGKQGSVYKRLMELVIKGALKNMSVSIEIDEEDRLFLSDYLFSIEEWTVFELYVFTSTQMFLTDSLLLEISNELVHKSQSYMTLHRNQEYVKQFLINLISELIDRRRIQDAKRFMAQLRKFIGCYDVFEKVCLNYFELAISYVDTLGKNQKKIEAYLASIIEMTDKEFASILERHYNRLSKSIL